MTPELSEFSYGFALTNELVGWAPLQAAPVFPNLIEEGKATGGYDVKLDFAAVPLFLQFKRADCLTRKSAREIKHHGLPLTVPFHRFAITERSKSSQHTSLVALDDGTNLVFYVAPRFHTLAGINKAWAAGSVAAESIFVEPSAIGLIYDDDAHHVSFDPWQSWFCSEPRPIVPLSIENLRTVLEQRLKEDARPLREKLSGWREGIGAARVRARDLDNEIWRERYRQQSAQRIDVSGKAIGRIVSADRAATPIVGERRLPSSIPPVRLRPSRPLSEEEKLLREIADEAQREFNALFVVIQQS